MDFLNTEFPVSKNFIEEEVRRFYDWINMDTRDLPDITIDVTSDTIRSGQFDHRNGAWETTLFPEFDHSNHRLAEGNLSNLSFRGKTSRKHAVHEAAHAYFRENFDLPELEYTSEDMEGLMNEEMLQDWIDGMDVETLRQIFQMDENSVRINPEFNRDLMLRQAEYVRDEYGEEAYSEFIRFAGLSGIDETLARIMGEKYVCNDITQLDSGEVYSNMRGTLYSAKTVDVEGVKVTELGEKVDRDGFQSVLEMSEDQLLDNYYEPKKEMTFA